MQASSGPGGVSQRLPRGPLAAGGDPGKRVSGRKWGEAARSWRSPGRAGRGVQASPRTRSEPLRLHVVSCVSDFRAERMWAQGLGLPPGSAPRAPEVGCHAENTEAALSLSLAGITVSEGALLQEPA